MAKPKAGAKAKSKATGRATSAPAGKPATKAKASKAAKVAKPTKAVANQPARKPDGASKAAGVEKAKAAVATREGSAKSAPRSKSAVSDASMTVALPTPVATQTKAPPAAPIVDATGLTWIDAGQGYQVALEGAKLVARNAAGKRLASVPKELKDADLVDQIDSMRDWLVEHERECIATVESWMLRSLPVPRPVLEAVWADPAWRKPLENAVVFALDDDGQQDPARAGLFRGVDAKRGVGIVDLDGETGWLAVEQVAILHPILIPDLDVWRELITQLGVTQGISQLHRETHGKPAGLTASSIDQFEDGKFAMLMHALGKARALGYKVRGGYATCKVLEGGAVCEARYWIGSDSPDAETYTGQLSWVDHRERGLEIGQVGPVAFSEGMRMASAIYAARVIAKPEAAS